MRAKVSPLAWLVAIQFVSMGAMEMSGPFWPLHIQRLLGGDAHGMTALLSALVYAGPMVAAMLLTPFWGRIGDCTGHKPMVLRALLALALCQAAAAFTDNAWALVGIRLLQGGFAGFIAAAQAYAVAVSDPTRRGRTLSHLQSATAVGSLAGPVLGGWLMDVSGFAWLCLWAAVACLACALAALALPADAPSHRVRDAKSTQAGWPHGWLTGILLVIVLIQAAKMMPQPFFALYVSDVLHAPNWLVGASYAASAATLALSAPLWGRAFDRWQPARTLSVIEVVAWLCALTLALTALAGTWQGFVASRLVWGVWQGALLPVAYALIARTVPETGQGLALGLGNSAAKAGALVGTLLGAAGMGFFGLNAGFWLVAATYALAAAGIRFVRFHSTSPAPLSTRCASQARS
ncbi:MFS transporter [Crenobacter cavernae]|uniref:MFS transporter n=1 Tax=Crenobacter cavernae TaxID=2290923 RepID=A0A345Y6F4_9NEIS|nr:MFS transporter [Crenobacter cavernae]AXK39506.1 MFS transporter [Crenobacter cavernae]